MLNLNLSNILADVNKSYINYKTNVTNFYQLYPSSIDTIMLVTLYMRDNSLFFLHCKDKNKIKSCIEYILNKYRFTLTNEQILTLQNICLNFVNENKMINNVIN